MSFDRPRDFAAAWIAAWNAHDLERVLGHYADDVVFRSPRIEAVMGDATCVVHGKAALRTYWATALEKMPDLHFVLDRVYAGKHAVTVVYRNHRGQSAAETMVFDGDGQVSEGIATYD